MFQACEVKMAKIAAHSTPSRLPGNSRAMKPRHGDRLEAEDGDRLQDVEQRHQHAFPLPGIWRPARWRTRRRRGATQPIAMNMRKCGAHQVVGQVPPGPRVSGRVFADLVGPRHLRAAVGEQHQQCPAPAAAGPSPSGCRWPRRPGAERIACRAWRGRQRACGCENGHAILRPAHDVSMAIDGPISAVLHQRRATLPASMKTSGDA